jgi:hypothetical protein
MTEAHTTRPTPFEDVNVILRELLAGIQPILGQQLVGMYLYGSLSLGDFDPASSDVDFLVVTTGDLPQEALECLRQMHADIAGSGLPYATRLEGSYIPSPALRRYDLNDASHPTLGTDWPFQVAPHGRNWIIERHIMRERGFVVWGPSPQTLIDPVSSADLRAAVCAQMLGSWRDRLEDEAWLRPRAYQAFAILTFCRALYTLQHGDVVSKPRAAAWARETYPEWAPMIEQALAWRSDHEGGDPTATIAFLRQAFDQVRQVCWECGR